VTVDFDGERLTSTYRTEDADLSANVAAALSVEDENGKAEFFERLDSEVREATHGRVHAVRGDGDTVAFEMRSEFQADDGVDVRAVVRAQSKEEPFAYLEQGLYLPATYGALGEQGLES
jgi:hypothetical protein